MTARIQHHPTLPQNVLCLTAFVSSDAQPENMGTIVQRHARGNVKMSSATKLPGCASINAAKDTMVIIVTTRAVIVLTTTVTVATVPV